MSEEIDHDAPTPVYRQLADLLAQRIENGTLAPGDRLPSEHEIEQEHGLARGTIRKAIRTLAEQGLVVTVRGKGSYVREPDEG